MHCNLSSLTKSEQTDTTHLQGQLFKGNIIMEDSDSLGDLELGSENIKLSFDELRQQLLKEPTRITKSPALCRALFHYCKDSKKHGRIIRFLFWPIIMSLV